MEVSPDDSCCVCLTLRSGTILIGAGNCLFYVCMFAGYLTSSSIDPGGLRDSLAVTSLDMSIFSIFCVQVLANTSLVVGAVKRIPSHTFPWLCANAVSMMIAMFCIGVTILFGTTKLGLNYNEYVTSLTIMGVFTGINLFCWLVIFSFRKYLIMEAQRVQVPTVVDDDGCRSNLMPNMPPPSYYEIEGFKVSKCPQPPEDAPPEYEAAVAMLPPEQSVDLEKGPVKRKKGLTDSVVGVN